MLVQPTHFEYIGHHLTVAALDTALQEVVALAVSQTEDGHAETARRTLDVAYDLISVRSFYTDATNPNESGS